MIEFIAKVAWHLVDEWILKSRFAWVLLLLMSVVFVWLSLIFFSIADGPATLLGLLILLVAIASAVQAWKNFWKGQTF